MKSIEVYCENLRAQSQQIDMLNKKMREEFGSYVSKRKYMSKSAMISKLESMGYHYTRASDLTDYFFERVEGAFQRGIYVVISRFVKFTGALPGSPSALISGFKEVEPPYFDPVKWYEVSTFQNDLKSLSYSREIIEELTPYFLLRVRAAFKRGLNKTAERLLAVH